MIKKARKLLKVKELMLHINKIKVFHKPVEKPVENFLKRASKTMIFLFFQQLGGDDLRNWFWISDKKKS